MNFTLTTEAGDLDILVKLQGSVLRAGGNVLRRNGNIRYALQGSYLGRINQCKTSGRSRQGFEIDSRARSAFADAQDRKEKLAAKKFLFI
jgi:hypothetical protein